MTHRMNPEIKVRWLAALRSGEYPQTKGLLHRTVDDGPGRAAGHCCLGVLCELAVADGVIERNPGGYGYQAISVTGRLYDENSLLPSQVREWAGLKTSYGLEWADPKLGERALPSENDGGSSFAQIADLIEEFL